MTSYSNKRIAKNTLALYIRMLLTIGVTLYTSRIVIEVLGIENYGIFDLIGGVVILFTFLSTTMTTSTQRFFCTLIGRGDMARLQTMFSSSLIAHLLLILLMVIVAETIGLWFVNNKLVIPQDRLFAANCVYQFSIAITITNVYRIPFNAAVLSYERMSFYAYTGIIEAFLKLSILWPLCVIKADKLILYMVLLFGVNVIIMSWYIIFVHTKLESLRHRWSGFKTSFVSDIFKFAGWSSFSAFANVGSKQGLSILINIFYGVTLNAAIAVMNQVSSAVYQFISNFQSAITPPLIKGYANGEFDRVRNLLITSSKLSFFLMMILITPVVFNIDSILSIWLEIVPPSTSYFCVFSLISLLPNTIGGPVWTVMQASGKIKRYQIAITVIILLNIPVYYLLLKFGFKPQYTILVQFVTNLLVVIVGTWMGLGKLNISLGSIFTRVFMPCFLSFIAAWGIIMIVNHYTLHQLSGNIYEVIIASIIEIIISIIIIAFIGMNVNERNLLMTLILSKLKKNGIHNHTCI